VDSTYERPARGTFTTPSLGALYRAPHPRARPDRWTPAPHEIRSHDQFNTTIYAENDRYRGIANGRRVVFLNDADMQVRGLQKDQWVDLVSHFEARAAAPSAFKVVPYSVPPGALFRLFPETNVLVPVRAVAEGSNRTASKSIVTRSNPSSRATSSRLHHLQTEEQARAYETSARRRSRGADSFRVRRTPRAERATAPARRPDGNLARVRFDRDDDRLGRGLVASLGDRRERERGRSFRGNRRQRSRRHRIGHHLERSARRLSPSK